MQTATEVKRFLQSANETFRRKAINQNRAGWVQQTYITDDTEALNARATALIQAAAQLAKRAATYEKVDVPPDDRRQLLLLQRSLEVATPLDAKESEELTTIMARLDATYGKGKWCPDPGTRDTCLNIDQITKIMATSRDEKRLREVWEGWHTISPPMRNDYVRFVELANKGAKEVRVTGSKNKLRPPPPTIQPV